ncbi:MAG: biopolymer transport protein ExbB [Halieaceae bacterium]|jgi:biopolymer transport protein ExbB
MIGGFTEIFFSFMDKGGNVLWLIAILLFLMWTLIFERLWFFNFVWRKEVFEIIREWEARGERKSWNAKQIRARLLSVSSEDIQANLPLITTMVALCPLLGLLGTVTGMIEVFNVMAVTGGGDAKSMAGGVERATIPTMAGMVAALSGLFANTYLQRIADQEQELLQDQLTSDH